MLINNDIDGVGDVVTDTVFGLVSSAPITAAPRPGVRRERGMWGMTQSPDGQGAGSTSTSATAQR